MGQAFSEQVEEPAMLSYKTTQERTVEVPIMVPKSVRFIKLADGFSPKRVFRTSRDTILVFSHTLHELQEFNVSTDPEDLLMRVPVPVDVIDVFPGIGGAFWLVYEKCAKLLTLWNTESPKTITVDDSIVGVLQFTNGLNYATPYKFVHMKDGTVSDSIKLDNITIKDVQFDHGSGFVAVVNNFLQMYDDFGTLKVQVSLVGEMQTDAVIVAHDGHFLTFERNDTHIYSRNRHGNIDAVYKLNIDDTNFGVTNGVWIPTVGLVLVSEMENVIAIFHAPD